MRLFLTLSQVGGTLALALLATTTVCAQTVEDDINGNKTPSHAHSWTFASDVGWFYTPGSSYSLSGIETKFGSSDLRNVTVEIFATSAANTPDLGNRMASAIFQPVADTFTGGAFASPVALTAGTQYFVGFRNVMNLSVNATKDSGATNLGVLRGSTDGSYSTIISGGGYEAVNYQPIIRFLTPAAIPEPAFYQMSALLALGGLSVLRTRARKARK